MKPVVNKRQHQLNDFNPSITQNTGGAYPIARRSGNTLDYQTGAHAFRDIRSRFRHSRIWLRRLESGSVKTMITIARIKIG